MKALENFKIIQKKSKEDKMLSPYELANLIKNIILDIEEINLRLKKLE